MLKLFRFLTLVVLLVAVHARSFAQNTQLRSTVSYPGQTLANVCGWTSPDGREYALVGASKGLGIVEITNPDAPVNIVQIPGPDNLWKEIKVYSHYAYVTSEGGGGVQIVDLSGLPSANLEYHNYTGTGEIASQIGAIHALHIDVTKGFMYTYGGNFTTGLVHDLNTDPYNPVYVGRFDQLGYIHDGYADNDTLYACHIYSGLMSMVDMTDKANPVLLGSVETPGKFTHNAWIHSSRKHVFTTDEATPSFVTSYDVSDPTDIKELDRFTIDNGNGSIGHNVHIINDFAVTSWYTGGVVITDVKRPDIMVKVGQYDTWAGTGPDFDGCWGAFPYFPSGTIIATNIDPGELFIITPTYQRACYVEGFVTDGCTGAPLSGATLTITGGSAAVKTTNTFGKVTTGQLASGTFTATITKAGYATQTVTLNLVTGEVSSFNVTLSPTAAFDVTGTILDAVTNQPLAGIPYTLVGTDETYTGVSNGAGAFSLDCVIAGTYQVAAGQWGYVSSNQTVTVNGNSSVEIKLTKGYYDDFNLDYGWSVDGTSPTGIWERGEPIGTSNGGSLSNPEFDVASDAGDQCYVTGNGGGQAGSDDVDGGNSRLISPPMNLTGLQDAILTFDYWFFNGGGSGTPNDEFEVVLTAPGFSGPIFVENVPQSNWRSSGEIHLKDYLTTFTDNVRVEFIATDNDPGHLVEAGIDVFSVIPATVGVNTIDDRANLSVSPNPSREAFVVRYNWPGQETVTLEVRNTLGQITEQRVINGETGVVTVGNNWLSGVYTATLVGKNGQSKSLKLVKN